MDITIEDNLNFASRLINESMWSSKSKTEIESQIEFIKSKYNDKCLNLSIIGEFSSGKSTFINSLLRENILETDVIQGTTVATTVIEYADEYCITIEYKNGKTEKLSADNIKRMGGIKQCISYYSANEHISIKLNKLIIGHPAEILKNNIRIIDTPGTNSVTRWHEEVTIKAIHEVSDVAIILTNAAAPMPNTLIEFIKENLEMVLENCIFVATKIDLIDKNDREDIYEFIKSNINLNLDLQDPIVLGCSPYYVVSEFDKEVNSNIFNSFAYNESAYKQVLVQSYLTESKIIKNLHLQRERIKQVSLNALFSGMFEDLTTQCATIKSEYISKNETLRSLQKEDLDTFISNTKKKLKDNYVSEVEMLKNLFITKLETGANETIKSIMSEFEKCDTITAVDVFCKTTIEKRVTEPKNELEKTLANKLSDLQQLNIAYMKMFWQEFEKTYDGFKALGISFDKNIQMLTTALNAPGLNTVWLLSELGQKVKKGNFVESGGMVAGAALGTAVVPIIGTIIGGLIGVAFGSKFAPKVSDVKNKTRGEVRSVATNYFDSLIQNFEMEFDSNIHEKEIEVEKLIEQCRITYKSSIDLLIEKDKQFEKETQNNIEVLNQYIDEIKIRSNSH